MDSQNIRELLEKVKSGELSIEQALAKLRVLPYEDLGFAKVDHHRSLRQGFPEVVLGHGKSAEQVCAIACSLASHTDRLLVTRCSPDAFQLVKERLPDAAYNELARALVLNRSEGKLRPGVMVVSGGTADLPVAEEAAVTAELMGNEVDRAFDVGVAGIHRLLDHLPRLHQARVVVAVAGMEGALPSVVSGLVSVPVIAVPTSIGYGASFNGLAPLLAMLNSCAAGVAVVNIDNGFGAGYLAALINRNQGGHE
ncbi:MAG: nickel pincer cofactor biosynthesis protein LarB [Chloroflexi bacterium]|nr:nickel pincer cofactor biosynthesis protein LarB [Chloroflexota bacterium]